MARIEVPMPQMGESIAEGTVSKWLKKVGDTIERDEPLLEISTDKVDAEIPAPQSGTLVEVMVQEGETVEVGTVVAFIDTDPAATRPSAGVSAPPPARETVAAPVEGDKPRVPERAIAREPEMEVPPAAAEPARVTATETAEDRLRQRSTPLVRRIAEEHGVDLAQLEGRGTGVGGRVTKQDLLEFLGTEDGQEKPREAEPAMPTAPFRPAAAPTASQPAAARAPSAAPSAPPSAGVSAAPSEFWKTFYGQVQHPEFPVREGDEVETMDKVRRLTAEHMVLAKRVAPHVHSFIEIDFTQVDRVRKDRGPKWKEQGAKVSFTAFVAWAVSRVLRDFPMLNATASGNNVIHRGSVNIGIAVDLDPGLIVPVIRDADHLSLVGIGNKIVDLAERARSRKLGPDEIQGATFSITNPGVLGTLVGMPIIPKGTSGILGTGAIEKRVVVVRDPVTGEDSIAIRKRSLFALGYDHRIVDGADAARFLAGLKGLMEDFPEDA
ncbi:MAG: dihydrolipoamide acetyltransferase family protein [Gemmatimonadota bacterium]